MRGQGEAVRVLVVGGLVLVCGVDALVGLAVLPSVLATFAWDPARPLPVLAIRAFVFGLVSLGVCGVVGVMSLVAAGGVASKQSWGIPLAWGIVVLHAFFFPVSTPVALALSRLPLDRA